jgi:hypothetical protein
VTISGWRIGTGADITSVTLNGVAAKEILSQTQDSVVVRCHTVLCLTVLLSYVLCLTSHPLNVFLDGLLPSHLIPLLSFNLISTQPTHLSNYLSI